MGILVAETVEENLRLTVGFVVAIFIRDKEEVGRSADPDAAEADFESADEIQAFGEDFAGLEFSVAIGVFEDDELIEPLPFRLADGIGVGFRDPDTAAFVESHGDRLMDVGFTDDGFGFEAGGKIHLREGMLGGIGRGVAEVVLFEVAEDGAGLEAVEMREGVFGTNGLGAGQEESGEKEQSERWGRVASDGGHGRIKTGEAGKMKVEKM